MHSNWCSKLQAYVQQRYDYFTTGNRTSAISYIVGSKLRSHFVCLHSARSARNQELPLPVISLISKTGEFARSHTMTFLLLLSYTCWCVHCAYWQVCGLMCLLRADYERCSSERGSIHKFVDQRCSGSRSRGDNNSACQYLRAATDRQRVRDIRRTALHCDTNHLAPYR